MKNEPARVAVKGLAHILSGNVGAQAVGLVSLPVLSRIFTPTEFGFFALVTAIVGVITPVATLRFDAAAMLPTSMSVTRATSWSAFLSTIFFGAVAALILQILVVADIAGLGAYRSTPFWVAVLVILTGFFTTLTQLSLRKHQYAVVARRTFLRSIATAVPQIGFGLVGTGGVGLVAGTAIGSGAGIISMLSRVREFLVFPGWRQIATAWTTYWRFPAIFAPSSLLNALGGQIPLIFFAMYFGLSISGQLGMAERIVGLPVTVLGYAVSQVIQAEVARVLRERTTGMTSMYLRYSAMLSGVAVAAGLGFGFLGAWLIPLVLGDQWEYAGRIVQVLALTSSVRLVATPMSGILVLAQRAVTNLVLDALRVVVMLIAIYFVLVIGLEPVPALWALYSAMTFTYIVTWLCGWLAARSLDLLHADPSSAEAR